MFFQCLKGHWSHIDINWVNLTPGGNKDEHFSYFHSSCQSRLGWFFILMGLVLKVGHKTNMRKTCCFHEFLKCESLDFQSGWILFYSVDILYSTFECNFCDGTTFFFLFVTSLTFCTNPRLDFIMNNHTMLSQIIFFGKFLHIFCNRKFGKNESANVFVDCCHMIFKRGFSVSPHFDSDLSIFAI